MSEENIINQSKVPFTTLRIRENEDGSLTGTPELDEESWKASIRWRVYEASVLAKVLDEEWGLSRG